MKRSLAIWLAPLMLGAWIGIIAEDTYAYCTTRERIELRKEGLSRDEIDELCGDLPSGRDSYPSRPPVQREATVCITYAGQCAILVGRSQVGGSCTCYNAWGVAFPGIAQ